MNISKVDSHIDRPMFMHTLAKLKRAFTMRNYNLRWPTSTIDYYPLRTDSYSAQLAMQPSPVHFLHGLVSLVVQSIQFRRPTVYKCDW